MFGRGDRPRAMRAVVLVVVAVNLAAGLLVSVLALRHAADQNRQTRIALAQFEADAAELAHQIAQCGIPGGGDDACLRALRRANETIESDLRHVRRLLQSEHTDLTRLSAIAASWPRPPSDLPELPYDAGKARDAAHAGDAWLASLRAQVEPLSDTEAAEAGRNSMLADVETVLLGVTALAVAVTLFRRFDNARRSAQLRALAERARTEARFRALVTHASDLILVVDDAGAIAFSSPPAERLLQTPEPTADQPLGELSDVLPPDERQSFLALLRSLADSGIEHEVRHTARWIGRDGAPLWIEASITDLRGNADVGGIVINGHDITEARELEQQLRQQAFTDSLTGLANRALFTDRLEQALLTGRRSPGGTVAHALLYLDLDEFKAVNDTRGHQTGDELLQGVAAGLLASARSGDTVARLGGDEFAVLIHDIEAEPGDLPLDQALTAVAERMLTAVRAAGTRASAGIALADDLVQDADDLVRRADLAMYTAKSRGGDGVVVFRPQLHSNALARAQLRGDLAEAAERNELRVLYQPVIALADGRLTGTEALLRWEHPTRGTISPDVFVPAAEESQDIISFGRWVLRHACRQASEWERHWGEPGARLGMAVNVSVTQLRDPDLLDDVRAALDDAGWPASALTLEVTESQFISEGDEVVTVLQELRSLGCLVAIDDFGTGYSSLSYLERLPADVLKIDRSFVQRLVTSREAQVLVEGIVTMAQGLGMELIAEGVEEREQADLLGHLGVRLAQGFLWARPLEPAVIEDRLRGGEHRRNRQEALLLDV